MNYIAATLVFYCAAFTSTSSSHELLKEIHIDDELLKDIDVHHDDEYKAEQLSFILYCGLLRINKLCCLFEWGPGLKMFISEFEHQLIHHDTARLVYEHLEGLGLSVMHYALEWFTTCFALSFSLQMSFEVQNLFLHNKMDNIIIRVGMSILIVFHRQLLAISGHILLQNDY